MKFNKQIIYFSFFLLVVAFQIGVPARLIWQQENVVVSGKAFKFRTAPIDPNDPFRGKYITLRFQETQIYTENSRQFGPQQEVFVSLKNNEEGFAIPKEIYNSAPTNTSNYIKVQVAYVAEDHVNIRFPFNRFYMEETKAPKAERLYFDAALDSTQIAYALVKVKNGNAVLEDVFINDKSVRDME